METMAPKRRNTGEPNTWPERLKRLRRRLKLSQRAAALRCRISSSQWSSFETGQRTPTRPIGYLIELLEKGLI